MLVAVLLTASAAGWACDVLSNLTNLTKPSATTTTTTPPAASTALGGTWATTQSIPGASGSLNDSCVNFKWAVTQFNGTAGSGTFSATCMGNVNVTGSASAALTTATSATWIANAIGTVPNQPPCAVAISGTATLEASNQIRIPYSGTTCLGPVSGTEVIQR